jgi:hypothetical protein
VAHGPRIASAHSKASASNPWPIRHLCPWPLIRGPRRELPNPILQSIYQARLPYSSRTAGQPKRRAHRSNLASVTEHPSRVTIKREKERCEECGTLTSFGALFSPSFHPYKSRGTTPVHPTTNLILSPENLSPNFTIGATSLASASEAFSDSSLPLRRSDDS